MSFYSYMSSPVAIVWHVPVLIGAPATMEEALASAKAPWEKSGWLRDQMQSQLDIKMAEGRDELLFRCLFEI